MSWTAIWNEEQRVLRRPGGPSADGAATFLVEGRVCDAAPGDLSIWTGAGDAGLTLTRMTDGRVDLRHGATHIQSAPGTVQPGEAFRILYRKRTNHSATLEVHSLDHSGVCSLSIAAHTALVEADCIPAQPVLRDFGGFAAYANHDAPVSDGCGLEVGTLVMTGAGALPVETLKPGDIVVTERGTPALVRDVVRREAVTLGSMNAIRVRAPYFGLTEDMIVSREAPVLLSGPEVEYLFGSARVTAAAGDLVDGVCVQRDFSQPVRDMVSLELDRPGCVTVGRACLATGRNRGTWPHLSRRAARSLLATAGDPRALIG